MDKGFKADSWCQVIQPLINGKGGGRAETAQAIGTSVDQLDIAMKEATKFAMDKLGLDQEVVLEFGDENHTK